jgi:ribosomal protein S13
LFFLTPGLGKAFKLGITNRLELISTVDLNLTLVTNFKKKYKVEILHFLNHYYSQVNSVNNTYLDLQQFNIIRLYLIKSYKGKCHSIGKPVNGQRT